MQTTETTASAASRYTKLGLSLHDLGNGKEAVACFKKAIEIKPTASEAICGLGDVFLKEDKKTSPLLKVKSEALTPPVAENGDPVQRRHSEQWQYPA